MSTKRCAGEGVFHTVAAGLWLGVGSTLWVVAPERGALPGSVLLIAGVVGVVRAWRRAQSVERRQAHLDKQTQRMGRTRRHLEAVRRLLGAARGQSAVAAARELRQVLGAQVEEGALPAGERLREGR